MLLLSTPSILLGVDLEWNRKVKAEPLANSQAALQYGILLVCIIGGRMVLA